METLRWIRVMAANGAARAIRVAAGISGPELAREVGVDPSTLSRWERGVRRPRGPAALRWAEVLRGLC